jgi:hypothetical protein
MFHGTIGTASSLALGLIMLIILVLEGNSIFGKLGPMASVGGVIGSGVGLTVVLYGIMAML